MSINVWTEPFSTEIIAQLKLDAAIRFRQYQLPESAKEWQLKRTTLLSKLKSKLHIEVDHHLDFNCRRGPLDIFDEFSAQQIYFQSVPGRFITASLFIPKGEGPFPAILLMHGHTKKGRLDENLQKTAQRMVQFGYVVLLVDAFGSGDRATVHTKYEYHGGMLGSMLFNIGEPLLGIQVVDNMRAVDFLCSLPMVDSEKIGATGSSGGGNQTMYLAAFDERIKAAVPVVSVGSYQSYIGGSNCVCELIPDGLEICEESSLLALVAPRAIMPCNALHDINPTFYNAEMMRTYTEAMKVFKALGCPEKLRNMQFNGPHSYPLEVQAEMLNFFNLHLPHSSQDCCVAALECLKDDYQTTVLFEKGQRPPEIGTIPEYLKMKAEKLAAKAHGTPSELATILRIQKESYTATYLSTEKGWQKYMIQTDRNRVLPFLFKQGQKNYCQILAAPKGKSELEEHDLIREAEASGNSVLVFDPWGCGECGYIHEFMNIWIEQHQLGRSLLWLGRRLMGEWVMDFAHAIDFVQQQLPQAQLQLTGVRDSAIAALYASILHPEKMDSLEMIDYPATLVRHFKNIQTKKIPGFDYVTPEYFTLALAIPDILKWGNVNHAMAMAPCKIKTIRPHYINGDLWKTE